MLGPAKQRPARAEYGGVAKIRRRAYWSSENLCGGIGVTRIQRQPPPETAAKDDFSALGEGFVHVDVLSDEGCWIGQIVNAITKQVVEIHRRQRVSAGKEILPDTRFEGAGALRPETGVGITERR